MNQRIILIVSVLLAALLVGCTGTPGGIATLTAESRIQAEATAETAEAAPASTEAADTEAAAETDADIDVMSTTIAQNAGDRAAAAAENVEMAIDESLELLVLPGLSEQYGGTPNPAMMAGDLREGGLALQAKPSATPDIGRRDSTGIQVLNAFVNTDGELEMQVVVDGPLSGDAALELELASYSLLTPSGDVVQAQNATYWLTQPLEASDSHTGRLRFRIVPTPGNYALRVEGIGDEGFPLG